MDSIKKSIVEIINDSLNLNIVDLSNFGSSPIIFNEYVKYLISNDIRPKLIIVPLNLRIFSPLDKNVDITKSDYTGRTLKEIAENSRDKRILKLLN